MNETMSLLMATTILALGGLGLYMYKSDDNQEGGESEEYNENSLFSSNFWGSSEEELNEEEPNEDINKEENYKDDYPKRRSTKSQARSEKKSKRTGGTKRRY